MQRREWLKVLQRDPWFAGLAPNTVDVLLEHAVPRRYRAGERVYSVNDVSTGIFAVLSGGVRLSQYTPSGKQILFSTFSPGLWFGVISEFDGRPRPHNAVAVEASLLLHVSSASFREIVSRDWRHCFALAGAVVALFRTALEQLSGMRALPYPARVAQTLLAMSDHEQVVDPGHADPRVTQEDLAAMVGVTRQTVNRLLDEWERAGVIARGYGRVCLLDHAALAHLSAAEDAREARLTRTPTGRAPRPGLRTSPAMRRP